MFIKILISLLVGAVCGICAYLCLDETQESKLVFLRKYAKEDFYKILLEII